MSPKKKYAVFTIDVECFSDTECINNTDTVLEDEMLDGLDEYIRILEKFDIKATMFLVCNAAENAKERIKEYVKRGHKLALHGYDHTAPMDLDKESFTQRTAKAKEKLEKMFNVTINGFRAPFFSFNDKKMEIIRKLGFKYDASYNGGFNAIHTDKWDLTGFEKKLSGVFKGKHMYEFGLVCQKIFGLEIPICGGGYARLINWPILKPAIKKYIQNNDYYVFYLHPFELSRAKIPKFTGLKNRDKYYLTQGIKSYPARIVSIIEMLKDEGFEFVTFDELTDIMKTSHVAE